MLFELENPSWNWNDYQQYVLSAWDWGISLILVSLHGIKHEAWQERLLSIYCIKLAI